MNVTILGSGSRGNAVVLEADGIRLLIDAGFNAKTLAARMATADIAPESISAVVLTHEHSDHVAGVCTAARRWGWKIFGTDGTIRGTAGLSNLNPITIDVELPLQLETMRVRCVRTPHDAGEPIAVVVEGIACGSRLGIAYDLGHVPAGLTREFQQLDGLILEANHDDEMLRAGPYPVVVQNRIASSHGHLNNRAAASLARQVAHRGLRHVVLAHLSQHNNTAALARSTVDAAIRSTDFRGALTVSRQDAVTSFTLQRARRAEQLSLL
ncbi:MAG: MBL fold metallo-hydrolase [Gemmatimonadetes bacterium]|nr:MBL fold metallo-hydrolase [Gemmatimonadota bacterium]